MALVGVQDGFISAQVSESSPSLKGECWIQKQMHFYDTYTAICLSRYWSHNGNVIKSARILLSSVLVFNKICCLK